MIASRFKSSALDYVLFKIKIKWKTTILLLFIDDMIINGNHIVEIQEFKSTLNQLFEMKIFSSFKPVW